MTNPAADQSGRLVLVTDDDDDLLLLVQTMLSEAGFEVATATNGREALTQVERRMPNLILLDMKMPVMSGSQFVSEFHARWHHRAKVVVMTAAAHAPTRAKEIGADGWLAKPFDKEQLLHAVRSRIGPVRPSGS